MWKIQLACVTVFYALGKIETSGPPAGKCNTENIVPVPIPIKAMEKHLNWTVLFTTDLDSVEDHDSYFITERRGGKNYKFLNSKIRKDKSQSKYRLELTYVDNIFIEDIVDDNGKPHRYYNYPLNITSSLAGLVYSCSDFGDPKVYYRFIGAPKDSVPSEAEIQQLLDCDRAIFGDSHGTLMKVPEDINK